MTTPERIQYLCCDDANEELLEADSMDDAEAQSRQNAEWIVQPNTKYDFIATPPTVL